MTTRRDSGGSELDNDDRQCVCVCSSELDVDDRQCVLYYTNNNARYSSADVDALPQSSFTVDFDDEDDDDDDDDDDNVDVEADDYIAVDEQGIGVSDIRVSDQQGIGVGGSVIKLEDAALVGCGGDLEVNTTTALHDDADAADVAESFFDGAGPGLPMLVQDCR